MFCNKCGVIVNDNDMFCAKCGNKINSETTEVNDRVSKQSFDLNKIVPKSASGKIDAIKTLKTESGLSLKESKDIIDAAYELRCSDPGCDLNSIFKNSIKLGIIKSIDTSNPTSTNNNIKSPDKPVLTKNPVQKGYVEQVWSAKGDRILKYRQNLFHNGLKDHKTITAPDQMMLTSLVNQQIEKWEEKWKTECEKKRSDELRKASAEEALRRTKEAEERLEEVNNILLFTLEINDAVSWNDLKIKGSFNAPKPKKPSEPQYIQVQKAPDKNDPAFQPKENLLTVFFKSAKDKAMAKSDALYNAAFQEWQKNTNKFEDLNKISKDRYDRELSQYNEMLSDLEKQKAEFIKNQEDFNARIEELKTKYFESDVAAILEYCDTVLNLSLLPDFIHKDFEIDYNDETKILIIDYKLPNIEDFPNVKEVKYTPSKNELKVVYQNEAFMEKLFDETIYKLLLRIIHEEFEADVINAIDAISVNGWVNFLNKATGNREDACIASIQVKKDVFQKIDLRHVDPKACFKNLKGVGSSKLAGLTPIQPILTMNKDDKRFVVSYDVANSLDDSTNLAAISWEDFEHLIREVFEREFSTSGGEVKVTQASRDGGVDAVAFDPDPIRGGKIVIQAKRYTNTVGVSAVRDLFGTVMNEGATKGILVTTADYGPDAYEFARNKPLTLLNGGHLLHLLEKHGHKAKIDLREAKIINMTNGN